MGLEAAQQIGGAYVAIGADLSGLKAAEAQSKGIATGIGNLKAVVQVTADTSQVRAAVSRLALPPVRVPLMLDMSGVAAQMNAMRGQLALPGPAGAGGDIFEGQLLGSSFSSNNGGGGGFNGVGGGAGFSAGGGAAAVAKGSGWFNKVHGLRGIKHLGIFLAAEGLMATGEAAASAFHAVHAETPEQAQAAVKEGEDAIKSLPVIGHLISSLGKGAYTALSATTNFVAGYLPGHSKSRYGFESDQGYAERVTESAKIQDEKTAAQAERNKLQKERHEQAQSQELSIRAALSTPAQAALMQAISARDKFEERGGSGVENFTGRLGLMNALVARARTGVQSELSETAGQNQQAQVNEFIASEHRKVEAVRNTNQEIDQILVSSLRLGNHTYEADLADFKQKWQEKKRIAGQAAHDLAYAQAIGAGLSPADAEAAGQRAGGFAAAPVTAAAKAARKVFEAQQAKQIDTSNSSMLAAAEVAVLRQRGETDTADLTEFDNSTDNALDNMDERKKKDYRVMRAAQRDAMASAQSRAHEDISRSTSARSQAANAAAGGESNLAGVIMTIAGMRAEVAHAQPGQDTQQVVAAQTAELRAMSVAMNAPKNYATEFDPLRERAGGPSGNAAKEQIDILNAIREYLRQIAGKNSVPAAG